MGLKENAVLREDEVLENPVVDGQIKEGMEPDFGTKSGIWRGRKVDDNVGNCDPQQLTLHRHIKV